ncbi:glycosyltransferase family 4 protein [Sulfitobacter sp. SK012]|uniref:glycosyltransferase family 4 protein n=1 Tax=Sulfitobacter sp. SK012 TaxID=1389005 RepID=UPI0013B463D8|nr:glycosyltransferase family 1 protein [Sulfitobacter sp. SK012]
MRKATGVDRVATELAAALLACELPGVLSATHPAGVVVDQQDRPDVLMKATEVSVSRLRGQLWEQTALLQTNPQDWLLSLCNMGPVLRRKQIVMMHDAQVFREPQSYSRAFRRWYSIAQPLLARNAALVLTVSEHSKRELEAFGVVPPGKARVVHNGADHILRVTADAATLPRFKLMPQGYILAIGSSAPHKNLAFLVKAAQARTDTSQPLVIAGGGDAAVFAGQGISASDNVKILGRVSDSELRALYENATALAFPSLTEGFGLPPLEAMACGCPVIASTGGAIPEICGTAAILLDPYDQMGWTAALSTITYDPAIRFSLSQAGIARAAQFTWAAAAETLVGYLAELAQAEHPQPA